ncbi:MAG: hypothetical protein KME02_03785 [Aphanothece saxicola GSE-SYN-MK-01-06B]|jgi:hypothetical protein|nr:hypothetical protein [Aphanothece saxicola GSE-SYN-MK-01-06B]
MFDSLKEWGKLGSSPQANFLLMPQLSTAQISIMSAAGVAITAMVAIPVINANQQIRVQKETQALIAAQKREAEAEQALQERKVQESYGCASDAAVSVVKAFLLQKTEASGFITEGNKSEIYAALNMNTMIPTAAEDTSIHEWQCSANLHVAGKTYKIEYTTQKDPLGSDNVVVGMSREYWAPVDTFTENGIQRVKPEMAQAIFNVAADIWGKSGQ